MFQHLVFVTTDSVFRMRFSKAEHRVIFLPLIRRMFGSPISMFKIIIIKLMGAVTIKSMQKFRTEIYMFMYAWFLNKTNKLM